MITFEAFNEYHFPLILEWLEKPHVKKWWDSDVIYRQESIKEKYLDYTKGYKKVDGVQKPLHAYIIFANDHPIGYIQFYNAYDFPRDSSLLDLPESLSAVDLFIGEEDSLSKGIGSNALKDFLDQYVFTYYRYAFVDPEIENVAAVRAYEKAGFSVIKKVQTSFWMLAYKPIVRLSVKDSSALEGAFRGSFLKSDKLWVFGSRADLRRKGGDLDLYVETNVSSIDEAVSRKLEFITLIKKKIGDQKIDVVLNAVNFPYKLPIYEIAKKEGVRFL